MTNPSRTRTLLLVALAVGFLPCAARAAPARIGVFEAEVHARPDAASPVIHTFSENASVSVSEDAVNGFRRVRLPDGKVGFVEERLLTFSAEQPPPPVAPAPPAFQPPPPPGYVPPPGYAPPPPGYAPPPPPGWYVPVRTYDPTAFRHVGFFLRFDAGLGYMGSSTSAAATGLNFDSEHGVAGEIGLAIGGAVAENIPLAGHVWAVSAVSPTVSSRGLSSSTTSDFAVSLIGLGPSIGYYLMPQNVYVSVTPSVTWLRFSDFFGDFQTSTGFGTRFALGKEWWVGRHWGLGVAGWFAFSFNKEQSGGPTWNTYTGGLALSSTFD